MIRSSMSDELETIRLKRSGHDRVDILPSQVSPKSLARIFSVSNTQSPEVTLTLFMMYMRFCVNTVFLHVNVHLSPVNHNH